MSLNANDRGLAIIVALLATMLLSGLGLSLVLLSETERSIAANYRSGHEALYGADAAIEVAVADLSMTPDWDAILAGQVRSSFADATRRPTAQSFGMIDLDVLTQDLQASSDSAASFGANGPVWRLFAWGALSQLPSTGSVPGASYLATWVSDDVLETDDDPAADSNDVVTVHAEAFGPGRARRVAEATVARKGSAVRIVSWRDLW